MIIKLNYGDLFGLENKAKWQAIGKNLVFAQYNKETLSNFY